MSRNAALLRSDAISLPLRDESVDLIVTSPPYFALRSYTDGGEHYDGQIGSEPSPQDFLDALWTVTAEYMRVLKPSGSIFVNLGDKYAGSGGHNNAGIANNGYVERECSGRMPKDTNRGVKATRRSAPDTYSKATIGGARPKSLMGLPWRYALGCIDQLDLILRAEIVWSKPNGLPESVLDRVRRSHEQFFHFTKEPTYFSAIDEVREEYAPATADRYRYDKNHTTERRSGGLHAQGNVNQGPVRSDIAGGHDVNPLGKLPGSVWMVPTESLRVPEYLAADHFAAFPQEWPRRLILGWSPPGGVVLDPFGGTGTTAMVARALGRFGISNDLSADYLRLAKWRIFDSGHAAKSRERTNREAQMDLLG